MCEPEKDEKDKGKRKDDEPTNGKYSENEKDDDEEEDGAAGAWWEEVTGKDQSKGKDKKSNIRII